MGEPLSSFNFNKDPFEHFKTLFAEAEQKITKDPNAMSLATVGPDGFPSLRTVLYKGWAHDGLTFFTNYQSHKSQDLNGNSKCAALFFWPTLERQIRIEGLVEKLPRAENEMYFQSRPRLSQIGAWASEQSQVIPNTEFLESKVIDLEKKYENTTVPCPPHWGGYCLKPLRIEFWFGRQGRLHERYVYEKDSVQANSWRTFMKSP